jgi:hypothetical protein
MPQLTGREMAEFIEAHYTSPGDNLFRMERLPIYAGNAAQTARWLTGAAEPDWEVKQGWLDALREDRERGLRAQRVRVFTPGMTDDERAACAFGYAYNGRYEEIRVIHRGEHPPVDILDHDYWLITPARGQVEVLRMHYADDGAFLGADVVPRDGHEPYLRESRLAWAIAEDFAPWWERHTELHERLAA